MINTTVQVSDKKTAFPNFLIVGMAKCGTSSLARYLQQNPDIFISKQKEPRFITSQCQKFPENGPKDHLVKEWYIKTLDKYLELFNGAKESAVGEASADTLYFYKDTIPVIKKYFEDPKIIIILRDPVKRAFSAYQHLIRDEREFLSFEEALEMEEKRIKDNWELIYHYRAASRYYEPVKAFMDAFNDVKVVLTEDLRKKPDECLNDIFDFLGVDTTSDLDANTKYNVSGIPKNKFIHDSLKGTNGLRNMIRPLARTIFKSEASRSKVLNWIWNKNLERLTIKRETAQMLYKEFREDILKTEELIDQDLSAWKRYGIDQE